MTPEEFVSLVLEDKDVAKEKFLEIEDNDIASECWIAMLNNVEGKKTALSWKKDPEVRVKVRSIFYFG